MRTGNSKVLCVLCGKAAEPREHDIWDPENAFWHQPFRRKSSVTSHTKVEKFTA
jgi:hypothetical protein